MDARSFRELGIECDYRHTLELAGGDHYAVGGGGVGGIEPRHNAGKRSRVEIALELGETTGNSSTLEPPKAGGR